MTVGDVHHDLYRDLDKLRHFRDAQRVDLLECQKILMKKEMHRTQLKQSLKQLLVTNESIAKQISVCSLVSLTQIMNLCNYLHYIYMRFDSAVNMTTSNYHIIETRC